MSVHIQKLTLLTALFLLAGCVATKPTHDESAFQTETESYPIQDAYSAVLSAYSTLPNDAKPKRWKEITDELANITLAHSPMPATREDQKIDVLGTSDYTIVALCYAPISGDILRIANELSNGNTNGVEIAEHRLRSLLASYPMSVKSNRYEHYMIVATLGFGTSISTNSLSLVRQRVDQVRSEDRLPLWVVLAEFGDEGAVMKVQEADKQQVSFLQRSFQAARRKMLSNLSKQ